MLKGRKDRQTYTITGDNSSNHPVGTICYEFIGHDYGCAREDTAGLRTPCITMTLSSDGVTGPFFTIPTKHLDHQPVSRYSYYDPKSTSEVSHA